MIEQKIGEKFTLRKDDGNIWALFDHDPEKNIYNVTVGCTKLPNEEHYTHQASAFLDSDEELNFNIANIYFAQYVQKYLTE